VLLDAFLADKQATMTMKGGNTDELYQGDGRLEMARSLQRQHRDVTRISRKWGRWQHHGDYRMALVERLASGSRGLFTSVSSIRLPPACHTWGPFGSR